MFAASMRSFNKYFTETTMFTVELNVTGPRRHVVFVNKYRPLKPCYRRWLTLVCHTSSTVYDAESPGVVISFVRATRVGLEIHVF